MRPVASATAVNLNYTSVVAANVVLFSVLVCVKMLITNEIEKALYNGECVFKTFNTGYTNTFTIPIPKGSYIILRQIIYYPTITSEKRNGPRIITTCNFTIIFK